MSVKLGGPSLHDLASISERIYPGWRGCWRRFLNTSDLSRKEGCQCLSAREGALWLIHRLPSLAQIILASCLLLPAGSIFSSSHWSFYSPSVISCSCTRMSMIFADTEVFWPLGTRDPFHIEYRSSRDFCLAALRGLKYLVECTLVDIIPSSVLKSLSEPWDGYMGRENICLCDR